MLDVHEFSFSGLRAGSTVRALLVPSSLGTNNRSRTCHTYTWWQRAFAGKASRRESVVKFLPSEEVPTTLENFSFFVGFVFPATASKGIQLTKTPSTNNFLNYDECEHVCTRCVCVFLRWIEKFSVKARTKRGGSVACGCGRSSSQCDEAP